MKGIMVHLVHADPCTAYCNLSCYPALGHQALVTHCVPQGKSCQLTDVGNFQICSIGHVPVAKVQDAKCDLHFLNHCHLVVSVQST